MIFILGLILPLIYIPATIGGAIQTGWILLSLTLPALLCFRTIEWTWVHILLLAFFGYALVTFSIPVQGLFGLWLLSLAGMSIFLGSTLSDLRPLYAGLAIGMGLNGALCVAQWLGYTGIFQAVAPSGLFVNKNILAETTTLVLIAVLSERMWWAIPGLIPGIALTHHRGSLLALGICAIVWLFGRSKLAAVATIAAGIVAGSFALNWDRGMSMQDRGHIWGDTIHALTWTGHGVGSFDTLYPKFAIRKDTFRDRPDHAHSDVLELVFEYGVATAAPVGAVAVALGGGTAAGARYVLLAFLVLGTVGFPLYLPCTAFLGLVCLGHLLRGNRWGGVLRRSVLHFGNQFGRREQAAACGADIPVFAYYPYGAGTLGVTPHEAQPNNGEHNRLLAAGRSVC
jgi:hypothetical protein